MSEPITWTNETRKLSDLTPWPRNPRQIDGAQGERLAESWSEFGQVETLAISQDGQIYNGHQRLKVLAAKHGPDFEVDVRVSSRPLTEREREKLTVVLHRGATGEWDWDLLADWDEGDLLGWGFDEDELEFDKEEKKVSDPGPQVDRAAELQEVWQTELGQIWELGEHRLACGDCTDDRIVDAVMDGEKADACITDPPWGVAHNLDYTRFVGGVYGTRHQEKEILKGDDKTFDPRPFLDYESIVLWGANFYPQHLSIGSWLVWDKRFRDGQAFLSDAELAWMKGGYGVYIFSQTSQGFVRPERVQHPTQKTIALIEWCMEKSKAGEIVYDPYLGSGTTLIACERLNRKCRAIEIEPKYVAVALQRYLDTTGKTPKLISQL